MLFNDDCRIYHSLLLINLVVSIPYVVALTASCSASTALRKLCDTLLSIKLLVVKPGFSCDIVLKISIIINCRFLSWVVKDLVLLGVV